MTHHPINVSYDDFSDVLYLTSGKVMNTKNFEIEAGLVLRYDLKTKKPVGATVIDYREYWLPKRVRLARLLSNFFGISPKDAIKVISSA